MSIWAFLWTSVIGIAFGIGVAFFWDVYHNWHIIHYKVKKTFKLTDCHWVEAEAEAEIIIYRKLVSPELLEHVDQCLFCQTSLEDVRKAA